MGNIHGVTRHDDGSLTKPCECCGQEVYWAPRQGGTECGQCDAQYNASGQRLRDDWRNNPSNYDDDISDLDGYEMERSEDQ